MADTDANSGRRVLVQKLYLRDASVEVPGGPGIFEGEWRPQIDVDLNFRVGDLGEQRHEVSVSVTVTAKRDDKTAYIVEVDQAGVFLVSGFDDTDEHQRVLGAYCPSVLFPYVRETVGDLVQRAGFPHFLLQPMNFDALFEQHRRSQDADAAQPATH
ncbi:MULTISPECIES: protein-export chaperone SecB [Spectribacter]|uniref:Protein-export protein SecB n=2 Tax=Spectribacter TaxID=3160928 RepID=A0ABU3BWX1_9GAMM|nr:MULTISPECIES: protein-export chaperone SecB [unclassified Salinisphaera]MDT0619565.1 protein-export chaperone SecB [Salinisphaera sp. P385]MDT0633794.1 protein-export chaperone SecB [Salinisphaera sp. W335]